MHLGESVEAVDSSNSDVQGKFDGLPGQIRGRHVGGWLRELVRVIFRLSRRRAIDRAIDASIHYGSMRLFVVVVEQAAGNITCLVGWLPLRVLQKRSIESPAGIHGAFTPSNRPVNHQTRKKGRNLEGEQEEEGTTWLIGLDAGKCGLQLVCSRSCAPTASMLPPSPQPCTHNV